MAYILLTVILLSVTFLLITGIIGWFIYSMFKRLRALPIIKKETKVINYLKQFSHGHATGWLLGVKEMNGRKIVRFAPDDLTDEELEKNKEQDKPLIETVVTKDIHIVPKGKGSVGCNIAYIFPKDIDSLVTQMPEGSISKGFSLGDGFSRAIIYDNVMKVFGKFVKAGDEASLQLVTEFGKGELSREVLMKMKELQTEKSMTEEEKKLKHQQ